MARYRKKPIIIKAFQWSGTNTEDDPEWIEAALDSGTISMESGVAGFVMIIKTLEGEMIANDGDYIIKGIEDEIYPCKAAIFEKTYEKVEDEEA